MPNTYPAVTFVARHGRRLAIAIAVAFLLATVPAALVSSHPPLAAAGVIGAAVLWAVARVAAELVEVIAETLLPR